MKTKPAYLVTRWENYDPPEAQSHTKLSWIRFPNSWDSLTFRRMATTDNAPSLFAAFVLIAQVASRQRYRGWLVKDGRPLEAADIALMTGFPEQIFTEALDYFSQEEIGWITKAKITKMEDHDHKDNTDSIYLVGAAGFENVQGLYPKRSWTMDTLVAIAGAVKREIENTDCTEADAIDAIRKATLEFAELTSDWTPADRRNKIPPPPTWFHEDRWKDPETWTPGRKSKSKKPKPSDSQL